MFSFLLRFFTAFFSDFIIFVHSVVVFFCRNYDTMLGRILCMFILATFLLLNIDAFKLCKSVKLVIPCNLSNSPIDQQRCISSSYEVFSHFDFEHSETKLDSLTSIGYRQTCEKNNSCSSIPDVLKARNVPFIVSKLSYCNEVCWRL